MPTVTVTGADTAKAGFTAHTGPAAVEFQLQVCDGEPLRETDSVVAEARS